MDNSLEVILAYDMFLMKFAIWWMVREGTHFPFSILDMGGAMRQWQAIASKRMFASESYDSLISTMCSQKSERPFCV